MSSEDILSDSEDRMRKTVDAVQRELDALRTGHAHVGLVDHVKVEYYGTTMPVNQMATVAAPTAYSSTRSQPMIHATSSPIVA